jgi:hypothetical protein
VQSTESLYNWFIVSGVTTHVTSDLNASSSSYPYTGPEVVHIDNGKGLSIAHKGSATLSTFFFHLSSPLYYMCLKLPKYY